MTRTDVAMLDELINNIKFTPRDNKKTPNDSVKLIAETAADANHLLRQYVAFTSQRAASHLNKEIQGTWAARVTLIKGAGQTSRNRGVSSLQTRAEYPPAGSENCQNTGHQTPADN